MKIQDRPVSFGISVALILFLLPFLGPSLLPGAVLKAADGVTHVIEFVAANPWGPGLNPPEIVICVGDSIEFKNNWIGGVNAFSYSKALRFDTGRGQRPGQSRTVGPFPEPGSVKVFDEIHSDLRGLILVVDCSKKGRTAVLEDGQELLTQFHIGEALEEAAREKLDDEELRKRAEDLQRRPKKTYRVRVHNSVLDFFGIEYVLVDRRVIYICAGDRVELTNDSDDELIFAVVERGMHSGTPATPPGDSVVLGPFNVAGLVDVEILNKTKANRPERTVFIHVVYCGLEGAGWVTEHQEIDWEKSDPDPSARSTPAADQSSYRVESGGLPTPRVQYSSGLETLSFQTPQGTINVHFPDDASAGDTISGTVVAEPEGRSDEERATNQRKLESYIVGLASVDPGGKPRLSKLAVSTSTRLFKLRLPPSVGNTPSGPVIEGHLYAGVFEEIAQGTVSMGPPSSGSGTPHPTAPDYQWPALSQQGHPVQVTGHFDGTYSNTSLDWTRSPGSDDVTNPEAVSGAFGLIAESPHKAVFRAPANVVGPIEITLKEAGTEKKGQTRLVGVSLSAPKTSLLKGERTTLSVKVLGLQGIKEPVQLRLVKSGVVSMQGGDVQTMAIKPGNVKHDGTYSITRTIMGRQAGAFSVTATLIGKESKR